MGKTFILVTQEAEKLGEKHLSIFLRHSVCFTYISENMMVINYSGLWTQGDNNWDR